MVLPYQQAAHCPAGQNFYSCYSGSYEGCCSHDPCLTGMCDSTDPNALCVPQTLTITQTVTSASTTLTSTSQAESFTPVAPFGLNAVTPSQSQSTTITLTLSGTLSGAPTTIASSVPIATAGDTTTSATTTASHKTTITTTPTPTSVKVDTSNPHTVPGAGPIAGGILGGLSALALISFLIFFCCRRRNKLTLKLRKNSRDPVSPTGAEGDKKKYIKETEEFMSTRAAALRQSTYVKSLERFDFGSPVRGGFGEGEGGPAAGRRGVGKLPEIGRGSPLGSPRSWI